MDKKGPGKGTLYIVATPIGNLEDITLRAVRILGEVDLIAAEDTRHTMKLLNACGVRAPMTSLFDFNERAKSASIIRKLEEGHNVAYVSDAGTPGISDPGYVLINAAVRSGIRVVPVPGPSAALAAISVSGLPMDSFAFYAFLPHADGKRRNLLGSLRGERKTMIFYESPRRLVSTLQAMEDVFGGERKIVIARELTKIHEEIIRGSVHDVLVKLEDTEIKGEITIVLAGAEAPESVSEDELRALFDQFRKDPARTTKDIVRMICEETGLPKSQIYPRVLQFKESEIP